MLEGLKATIIEEYAISETESQWQEREKERCGLRMKEWIEIKNKKADDVEIQVKAMVKKNLTP